LHKKYGPVVRTSPNEVAFADPDCFKEILAIGSPFWKAGGYPAMTIATEPVLFSMQDPKEAAARRKAMAHGFTKSFLRQNWEQVVREKVALAVTQIKGEGKRRGAVDIFKWFTLLANDIAAELMFGESLRNLESGEVRF